MTTAEKLDDKFSIKLYDGPSKGLLEKLEGYSNMSVISPGNFIMPGGYKNQHTIYQTQDVQATDIWVCSFPKAGTTWTQELVWTLLFGIDHQNAKLNLMKRFPFFEWGSLLPEGAETMEEFVKMDDNDPCKPGVTLKIIKEQLLHPRTIKTHLSYNLLPREMYKKKPKIIYVCRDPKDVCVSYYYHSIKLDKYAGNFDEFFDMFISDALPWCPFWFHVLQFWKRKNDENMLFLRYEEMKQNLPENILKVAKFLNKEITQEILDKLTGHLSFSTMSKNKAANNEFIYTESSNPLDIKFMRKGEVGDWKNHFSKEQEERFRKWTNDNLKGSDFPYYKDF